MKKRIVALLTTFIFCSQHLAAQIDTTRKEFFPMHLGDLWQYRTEDNLLWTAKIEADTLIEGRLYYVFRRIALRTQSGITRTDSLLRVQIYGGAGGGGDTCGGEAPREWSVYRLAQPDSSVWRLCENFWGYLSPIALARFNRIFVMYVFGQPREVMSFDFGGVNMSSGDTTFGSGALLARGIGVLHEQYFERGYRILQGCIIDSVQYGTIVGIEELASTRPINLMLIQNFPNPFNPSTQIRFQLPEPNIVVLMIFDVLGRKVAELVNGYREAGSHSVTWDATAVASGVYFARLTVSNELGAVRFTKISKLLLVK